MYTHLFVKRPSRCPNPSLEQNLTVKFRHLPPKERRLYQLTLGYCFGEERKRNHQRSDISSSQASMLMAKFRELLGRDGRTISGIIMALGIDASCVSLRQYRLALDYISSRTGTGIPFGGAEKAFSYLYEQGDKVWDFLDTSLGGLSLQDVRASSSPDSHGEGEGLGETGLHNVRERPARDSGGDQKEEGHRDPGALKLNDSSASFSIDELSAALSTLSSTLEEAAVRELANFLYLEGRTKIGLKDLKALAEKYGRSALERTQTVESPTSTESTDAKKRLGTRGSLTLTDHELDMVVDYLVPTEVGHIDLQELIRAFENARGAFFFSDREGPSQNQPIRTTNSEVEGIADPGTLIVEHGTSTSSVSSEPEVGLSRDSRERGGLLFSAEEVDFLASNALKGRPESTQITLADLENGIEGRGLRKPSAVGDYSRRAIARFSNEMSKAGFVLESRESWKRWFGMCDGAPASSKTVGTRRTMDRISIQQGLDALAGLVETQGGSPGQTGLAGLAWTESEVDGLIEAAVAHLDKAGEVTESQARGASEAILTEEVFRKGIMTALEGKEDDTEEAGARDEADHTAEVVREVALLWERLQSYLRDESLELVDILGRTARRSAGRSGEEVRPSLEDPQQAESASALTLAEGGQNPGVSLGAFRETLMSLRIGGCTRVREIGSGGTSEAATGKSYTQQVEGARSELSTAMRLLESRMSAQGMTVIDIFKASGTSKGRLMSREELHETVRDLVKESSDPLVPECTREPGDEGRQPEASSSGEPEKGQERASLMVRLTTAEGSGVDKILRRIHEHLRRARQSATGMFQSFSRRRHLELTPAELDRGLSSTDGVDLTRREVHQLVKFLGRKDQGAVGIPEIVEILREFEDMMRDVPSLGAAPMTVVDPLDLDIIGRSCFSEMLHSRHRRQSVNHPKLISQENVPQREGEGHRTSHSRDGADLDQPEPCVEETSREGQPKCVERTPSPHEHNLAFPAQEDRVVEYDAVTAEDISMAFDEAARKAKCSTQDASGAECNPLIRDPATRGNQVCMDKVMEWLRSSRTFDRAPTGRIPTSEERMTERQRIEHALQRKIEEEHRREAGQRHWEEWAAAKRVQDATKKKQERADDGSSPRKVAPGPLHSIQAETELRRKAQEEAFASWAREKDKILRARRREKRREMNAIDQSGTLRAGGNPRESRRQSQHTTASSFPLLALKTGNSSARSPKNKCCFGTRGSKGSKRIKRASRAQKKVLDLAATKVAVSPYRVGPKELYDHAKHIEGAQVVASFVRNRSAPLPKTLVQYLCEYSSR